MLKEMTIGVLLIIGLSACSTAGSLSASGRTVRYDLPSVVYERHEAVVYPAGGKSDY